MAHNTQFRYWGVVLLLLISSGMTSAVAGNAALVSPGHLLRPTINVVPHQARQYHYRAVTRAAVRKRGQVRASTLTWQCQGTGCTISGPWPTPAVGACRALAKQVGAIQSYGHAGRKLSTAQLKQCNAGITVAVRRPVRKQIRQAIARPVINAPRSRAQIAPVVTRPGHPVSLSAPRVLLPTHITKPAIAVAPVIRPARPSSHRPAPRLRVPVTIPKANPINRPTGLAAGRQARKFISPPALHGLQPKKISPKGGFALSPRSGVKVSGLNKPVTARGGKSLLPPGIPSTAKPISDGGGFAMPGIAGKTVSGLNKPVTGRDGMSPINSWGYLLKPTFKMIDNAGTRVLQEVEIGQAVIIQLTFHNIGTNISPSLIITNRGREYRLPRVDPNGMYRFRIRATVDKAHTDAIGSVWFYGRFNITSRNGDRVHLIRIDALHHDVFPIGGPNLSVQQISDVQLKLQNINGRVGRHLKHSFRQDVFARVKIKNIGTSTSAETTMLVTLRSTRQTRGGFDPQVTFIENRGSGPVDGSRTRTINISALPAGADVTVPVNFGDVHYKLMEVKRSYRENRIVVGRYTAHYYTPGEQGLYGCAVVSWKSHDAMHSHWGWGGSSLSIEAAPALPNSHGLIYRGTFRYKEYAGDRSNNYVCKAN